VTRDNIALVREMSDVFNRRDIGALLALLDPDVEWIPIMAMLEGRVYRGHDGVCEWIEHLSTDWELFETHQEQFREIGDRVLILGHWRARARASGVELEGQPASWLVDIRDGKIVRLQTFTDRQEALAAATHEEPKMSQPDKDAEVVRRAWAALSQRDVETWLDCLDPKIEAVPFGAAMEGRSYCGHGGVMEWWDDEVLQAYETFKVYPEEFREVGGHLLVFGHWVARGKESGVELEVTATWVVDVRDGKIVRWQTYTDRDEALAAVGLSG
jgi:uncharacterized protein